MIDIIYNLTFGSLVLFIWITLGGLFYRPLGDWYLKTYNRVRNMGR